MCYDDDPTPEYHFVSHRGSTSGSRKVVTSGGGREMKEMGHRRQFDHSRHAQCRASSAPLRDLLDAPTALAACCGFDLCHKYILYLYLYLYL